MTSRNKRTKEDSVLFPSPAPRPRDGSETKEMLLQAWISGWFLRSDWGFGEKRILPSRFLSDFQLHALIEAETWSSKSFFRQYAGLDSLEAEGAG